MFCEGLRYVRPIFCLTPFTPQNDTAVLLVSVFLRRGKKADFEKFSSLTEISQGRSGSRSLDTRSCTSLWSRDVWGAAGYRLDCANLESEFVSVFGGSRQMTGWGRHCLSAIIVPGPAVIGDASPCSVKLYFDSFSV